MQSERRLVLAAATVLQTGIVVRGVAAGVRVAAVVVEVVGVRVVAVVAAVVDTAAVTVVPGTRFQF